MCCNSYVYTVTCAIVQQPGRHNNMQTTVSECQLLLALVIRVVHAVYDWQ